MWLYGKSMRDKKSTAKRIYVIEELCNGCRLCESFCGSLATGIFAPQPGRIRVLKMSEKSVPLVHCEGRCVRPIYDDGSPTCVRVCPTGALIFATLERAAQVRQEYDSARQLHSLFKVVAPWIWPFPWRRPGEPKARSADREVL
jgi:Fe-S-cluster-containing dehydrogenase component